jgi:hypothetical protein
MLLELTAVCVLQAIDTGPKAHGVLHLPQEHTDSPHLLHRCCFRSCRLTALPPSRVVCWAVLCPTWRCVWWAAQH